MITLSPSAVSIFVMIAVFLTVIAIFTVQHGKKSHRRRNKSVWIFDNWQENVYDSLFEKEPQIIAKSIGVDLDKYIHDCKICKENAKLKKIVVERLLGILTLILFVFIGIALKSIVITLLGCAISFPVSYLGTYTAQQKAKARKLQIISELPRFLDLLHTSLAIGLPVEQAIDITADSLKNTILAKDFKRAMADAKMGACSWQEALEKMASEYEVDILSDFILDITNAYNNGSPIIESVVRQSKDIKQSHILMMKEKSAQLSNIVLVPILIFKIIPILAIVCVPIVIQLNSSGFIF